MFFRKVVRGKISVSVGSPDAPAGGVACLWGGLFELVPAGSLRLRIHITRSDFA